MTEQQRDQHVRARYLLAGVMIRLLIVLGAALPSAGLGATGKPADWLDEMPSVSLVVYAVRTQLAAESARDRNLSEDHHRLAARLLATFYLMRQFMQHKAREEGSVSRDRQSRIDVVAHSYLQVEHAIGQGVGNLSGLDPALCARGGWRDSRGNRMFHTTTECVRWRLKIALWNDHASGAIRGGIFPLLFCERGREYHESMQRVFTKLPSALESPAVSGLQPPGVLLPVVDMCSVAGAMPTTTRCATTGRSLSVQRHPRRPRLRLRVWRRSRS